MFKISDFTIYYRNTQISLTLFVCSNPCSLGAGESTVTKRVEFQKELDSRSIVHKEIDLGYCGALSGVLKL